MKMIGAWNISPAREVQTVDEAATRSEVMESAGQSSCR
jgi:hypothetical protein